MNLIFFNNFHNGDIHLSRNFIIDIMKKIKCDSYSYHHKNDSSLLKDIVNLNYINKVEFNQLSNEQIVRKGDDLIINTWIGQQNFKYLNNRCSLYSYYKCFCDIYQILNINIENIEYYVPDIDWSYIEKNAIDDFILKYDKKKVLISNGLTESGQSKNFDFDIIIDRLLTDFKDIIFIVTAPSSIKSDNLFYTSNIINLKSDLNEISYLSNFCETLIGRSSGPFTFCYTKDNLMNEKKKFISFSQSRLDSVWYQESKCNFIWSNNYDMENIYNTIKQNLI